MIVLKMLNFATNKKLILDSDAKRFYNELFKLMNKKESIELDMYGVEYSVSSFFNASIGFLFKDFKDCESKITIKNVSESDKFVINKVISRAKAYYQDPENYINIDEV